MSASKIKRFCFFVVIAASACIASCSKKPASIQYPSPQPDSIPLNFMPGIVSTDSLDFNLAFSNDGKTVYFCRSRNGKWIILQSMFDGKQWTKPVVAPFSEPDYSQADPFITKEGSLYYISNRPRNAQDTARDYDIWVVHPDDDGGWSEPQNIPLVNSDSDEYYVSVGAKGNLYFASNRPGGYGEMDLYISLFANGKFRPAQNLGADINTANDEHDPLTLRNETSLIFASSGRPDCLGQADLYHSIKKMDGKWSTPSNMARFNTPTYEYCPNVSPDGKYFFYSSEMDVKWVRF